MAATRRDWFARMLESSLQLGIQTPDGLLEHATPSVLVDALPSEEVAAVLSGALKSGKMSASHVVDTVTVATLNEFLPEEVLWASLDATALGIGLDKAGKATDKARAFLAGALVSGLETAQLTAEGLLERANPSVLTENLPAAVSAKLLQASLSSGAMSAQLVVDTIPPEILAEHLPAGVLWGCVSQAAGGAKVASKARAAKEAPAEVQTQPPSADQPDADELDELDLIDEAMEAAEADADDGDGGDEPESKRSSKPSPSRVLGNTGIGKPSLGNSRIRPRR